MAGLLEFLNTPQGMGLLSGVASYAANARRGQPVNSIGRGLIGGLTGYAQANDQIKQDEENAFQKRYRQMQMDEMQRKMEQAKAQQTWKAGLPQMMDKAQTKVTPFQPDDPFNQGPAAFGEVYGGDQHGQQTDALMANVQQGDPQALQQYLMHPDSPYADKLFEQQFMLKDPEYKVVGNSLVGIDRSGVKPVYTAPEKPAATPSGIQEYQFAVQQGYKGSFADWKTSNARAGATNVTNRIENKVGESIAGQVGPIMKASAEKTTGAINLANSSRLMLEALDKGNVYVGPTANARLKLAQFGQVLGVGGKDEEEKINNTRQLIRSLSEGAVEARKELAGQGQVTENEAAAVTKAYSGNIEDLTVSEIRLIAGLNIKREKLARQRHQRILKNAPASLQPYYQVDPEAPANPGGGWGIQRVE